MRKNILFQILLFTAAMFVSYFCIGCDENNSYYSFEMYYLEDAELSYTDAANLSLQNLSLQKIPFLTANDIKTYTVNYLEGNPINSYNISLKGSSSGNFAGDIRPFVLVVNGNRFGLAEYWPGLISIYPKGILMYKSHGVDLHLRPNDDTSNTKLKDPIIVNTLHNLGVEIVYKNIGGE